MRWLPAGVAEVKGSISVPSRQTFVGSDFEGLQFFSCKFDFFFRCSFGGVVFLEHAALHFVSLVVFCAEQIEKEFLLGGIAVFNGNQMPS